MGSDTGESWLLLEGDVERTSGAKAPIDGAEFVAGLKPCPTTDVGFSALGSSRTGLLNGTSVARWLLVLLEAKGEMDGGVGGAGRAGGADATGREGPEGEFGVGFERFVEL